MSEDRLAKPGTERTIQACLIVAALIHFVPVIGVVGGDRLSGLYGIPMDGTDLSLLMRHRAVLFGILGVLLVAGAIRRSLRQAAFLAGFVSVVSFLALAATSGELNAQLARIVTGDVVALVFLVVGVILHARQPTTA